MSVARKGKRKKKLASPKEGRFWTECRGPLVLIAAGTIAYINSFRGIFIFDDLDLPKNLAIQTLWPPWGALFAQANISRPLVGLSLAVNYALSGFDVWSYHLVNLAIHLIAGLLLFGIVRRTLLNPRLSSRFGEHSTGLALSIALIWLVHPLQTQSVTYIIQRGESQMGMFYFLTLYCVIRSDQSSRKGLWYGAAVAAATLGMLSKQIMVTAPIVVLVYDFLFLSGSLAQSLRKRWPLYAGLAASWAVLAATIIAAPRNPTAGFAVQSISPWDYFKSEFGVIIYYIRLSFWPDPLCLDYAWPKAVSAGRVLPYAMAVLALESATAWALWKRKPIAFLGVWFFGILSVSSTFMPFSDLAFEHRMYLSLAAVVVLAVLAGYTLMRRAGGVRLPAGDTRLKSRMAVASLAVALLASILVVLTIRRNADYGDGVRMWQDAASKRPENARALTNLGEFLAKRGDLNQAVQAFSQAVKVNPDYALAHENLGMALVQENKPDEAIDQLSSAIQIDPTSYDGYTRLGAALASKQRFDEAEAAFSKALAIVPDYAPALANLGFAQERQGKTEDALNSLNKALPHTATNNLSARIHFSIGTIMASRGDSSGAVREYREALKLEPGFTPAREKLDHLSGPAAP
jgi:tetratricopeptide (TPR) repeat protein